MIFSSKCLIRAPSALLFATIEHMTLAPAPAPLRSPTLSCECGEPLADDVDDRGVVTVEGLAVAFRRRTDYVLCGMCLAFYRVADLRVGRVRHLTLMEIKFLNELEHAEELEHAAEQQAVAAAL
jgi:hypothetical protein